MKRAFLNADLEEEIYVKQPPEGGAIWCASCTRLSIGGPGPGPPSSRGVGFRVAEADPGLFIRHDKTGDFFLLVYVDDILISAPEGDTAGVDLVKRALKKVLDIHDLGEAIVFLGMEIVRDRL